MTNYLLYLDEVCFRSCQNKVQVLSECVAMSKAIRNAFLFQNAIPNILFDEMVPRLIWP